MKKLIALLMIVILSMSLCACTSDEDLIVEANKFMLNNPYQDVFYVEGEYDEDYNCYGIILCADVDFRNSDYDSLSLEDQTIWVIMDNQYTNSDGEALDYFFNGVKEIFADSDIDVTAGYKNRYGEYIDTRTTIEAE